MTERAIERVVELDAAPDRVWSAITNPAELSQWFGDEADLDLRPGGDGAMTWQSHGRFAMRVEVVDAPLRLVWRWVHEPDVAFEEASSTRVEWSLQRRPDGGTTLKLRESGFQTDQHQRENTEGWTQELGELAALLGAAG